MKIQDLPFNKNNFITLKKERDMLKITLQYVTQENINLKNELNDMKITAKKNKDMLKEYINQITNKDKLFEKMASTIEILKSRLKAMEQFKKEKEKEKNEKENTNYYLSNDYLNINNNTNNHTTTTTSNNFTTNNILGTTNGENYSFGFNILNSNNINKIKNNNLNLNEIISTKNSKNNKSMNNINVNNKGFNILRSNKKNKNNNNMENIIYKNQNNKINSNENQNLENNKESNKIENITPEDSIKYFYEKQKNIMEEISIIKDDIQFLMENRSKSKIKDKLNQSLASFNSLNSSFCSENKNIYDNQNKENNLNNSMTSENNGQQSLDNSYISQNISNLSVSYYGADQNILRHLNYTLNISSVNNTPDNYAGPPGYTDNLKLLKKRKNYNLKERYCIDENFTNFIFKTNVKKDILFLIDGKENVWEIIKRGDLTAEQIKKYDKEKDKEYYGKIKSIINIMGENNNKEQNIMNLISGKNKSGNYVNIGDNIDKERGVNFLDNNLIDIEIKEPTDNIFK